MTISPIACACDKVALGLLWSYRRLVSPLVPPACRFYPSCSAFAEEAVRIHGCWRGGLLALGRILRCHPWNPGGVDPVPGAGSAPGNEKDSTGWADAHAAVRED